MKTTVEIPDALLQKANSAAVSRGQTLDELVITAVEREVNQADPVAAMEKWLKDAQKIGKEVAAAWNSDKTATETISEMRR